MFTYAGARRFRNDDHCACGAQETVSHVLVDCLRLKKLRSELNRKVGDAFSSVSSLLGDSREGEVNEALLVENEGYKDGRNKNN